MKTNLTFRSLFLALLMVVLLLSSPFATFAQQISAETQAKQDAEADLNKRLWIGTGCAIPLFPVLGLVVGSLVPQSSSRDSLNLSNQQKLGICVGLTFACLGPRILARRHQPTPPPERFIGKPPEYIAVYTDAYKTRTQRLRRQYTGIGFGIGCGVLVGLQAITELIMED